MCGFTSLLNYLLVAPYGIKVLPAFIVCSHCCFAEGLWCHPGSPGNTKTGEAGEESILAVEKTLNAVLIGQDLSGLTLGMQFSP